MLLLGACAAPGEGLPESTTQTLVTRSPSASSAPTGSSAAIAWRRIPDIPTARSEVAATAFRGEVYVIGGFGGGRVVEIFDGQRWRRGPDLPLEVDHAMAASVSDTADAGAGVYVFGGNAPAPIARGFRLAPDATAWREIAAMPGPRSQAAAVEEKAVAPWLRRRAGKMMVVDLDQRIERPASEEEQQTGERMENRPEMTRQS